LTGFKKDVNIESFMKRGEKMKKKYVFLTLVIALTFMITGCTNGEESATTTDTEEPLVVAMELAYPPFETKDDAGNPTGISVDFAKAFGEYIGRDVEIVNTAWDGLIPSLQTGKADMVISSMTITEERAETVDFSEPYANSLLGMLVNKNSEITEAEDLNQEGKTVAVKVGSTGEIYARNNLTNAEILSLPDESACVTEVTQGKADAFLYDQLTIYRNWKANEDTTDAIFIPFQDAEKWGVAVQKGDTELLDQMNAFIDEYTEAGGFDELSEKYLSEEKKTFDELGFKWFFDVD